jgi:hypothetical protein
MAGSEVVAKGGLWSRACLEGWYGEGLVACWVARVRSLAIPGLFGGGLWGDGLVVRADRRTPCAGRGVMLTAVQSLRLAGTETGWLRVGWREYGASRSRACSEGDCGETGLL